MILNDLKNFFGLHEKSFVPNVGIGTTSPNRRLEVAGPVCISPAALPGSPGAGDLATDSGASNSLKFYNGTEWRSISGRTNCPTGFSLVGTSGSSEAFCISTNEETPLTWVNAVTNCANKTPNARLCSIDEWVHACVKASTYFINNMGNGDEEWVADLLNGSSPNARAMDILFGSSCVGNDAFLATSNRRSRCCFR